MQAARMLMRSTFRTTSLLSQTSSFATTTSSSSTHRLSSSFTSSIRRFSNSPSQTTPGGNNPNPAPRPNPFAAKPAGETDTETAAPTTVQSHSGSSSLSGSQQPADDVDSYDRLPDAEPYQANWVDFRPNLVEVHVTRNEEGDLIGYWEGEEVIFPDLETSLEWVLSTPVPTHCFEEVPIIKECPEAEEAPAH